MITTHELITFVKTRRKQLKLTQQDLADRAGVGLRFIRDLEQGKESLQLDKVNQVLFPFFLTDSSRKVGKIHYFPIEPLPKTCKQYESCTLQFQNL